MIAAAVQAQDDVRIATETSLARKCHASQNQAGAGRCSSRTLQILSERATGRTDHNADPRVATDGLSIRGCTGLATTVDLDVVNDIGQRALQFDGLRAGAQAG